MSRQSSVRRFTLIQRELREYKVSLVWTPLIVAVVLSALMLLSVLVADRISVVGTAMWDAMIQEESAQGMNIRFRLDGSDDQPMSQEIEIETYSEPEPLEDWDLSQGWEFDVESDAASDVVSGQEPAGSASGQGAGLAQTVLEDKLDSLNPLLQLVHNFMLMILISVTVNYLLGCLFNDRRDRSILFWKSMPVSEWEVVLSKLSVALLVVPVIFLAVSLILQLVCMLVIMLWAQRMDMDPLMTILGNVEFAKLFIGQIGGWVVTALLIAPLYAWIMVASAWAKRSPFMVAVVPILALVLCEWLFLGSDFFWSVITSRLPDNVGDGGELHIREQILNTAGPVGVANMFTGLLIAMALLWGAVSLRRYRWEI